MKLGDFVTGVQHIGLPTECLEETVSFYESLGFQVAHRSKVPETGQNVVFVKLQNTVMEIYQVDKAAGAAGAIDHIALDCNDIQSAYELAKRQGYRLTEPQIGDLPFWENGVRFFTIQGPNGEKIEWNERL